MKMKLSFRNTLYDEFPIFRKAKIPQFFLPDLHITEDTAIFVVICDKDTACVIQ